MRGQATREQIVEAADDLFYRKGYEHTSFADIAAAVRISRGNFYYHFKTKDEILGAVIVQRLTKTQRMLERWEAEGEGPADHIRSFIRILSANRSKIMLHGCPVGTLCTELAKLDHVAQDDANRVFALFRDWLARKFILLGRSKDAEALALHLLVLSQGVATMAAAFRDEAFITREVDRMEQWLAAQSGEPARGAAKHC